MDCTEIKKYIPDLLLNELPEAEKQRVLGHLERCPACRQLREELQSVWRSLGSLDRLHFPPTLARRVVEEISPGEAGTQSVSVGRFIYFRAIPALAASLLLAAGIYFIARPDPASDISSRVRVNKSATTFKTGGVSLPDPGSTLRRYLTQSRDILLKIEEERYNSWDQVLSDIIGNDLQGKATFLLEEPSLPAPEKELIRSLHDATWGILKTGRNRPAEKVTVPNNIDPARLIEAIDRYRSDRETYR